jgi:hypothetical protein
MEQADQSQEQTRELDRLNRQRVRAQNDVQAFKTQIKDLDELKRMD